MHLLLPVVLQLTANVFTPAQFHGTDTERIQKALDAAVANRGTCQIPWTGKPYVVEDTLVVRPVKGDTQARLRIVGDPQWNLIDYQGQDGKDVFRFFGLKGSRVENVGVRVHADRVTAFALDGDAATQSSSQNRFVQCHVVFWKGTSDGVGYWMGRGGNDHSGSVFDQCIVSGEIEGALQDVGHLRRVATAGHRGFVFTGPNNLAPTLRDCSVMNCVVGYQFARFRGYPQGGSGAFVEASGTSAVNLVFLVDGGFPITIVGGRDELGGALLVHGDPKSPGRGDAVVAVRNRMIADFKPREGAASGLTEAGELVGLRSAASFLFEGVTFPRSELGEELSAASWILACNDPSKRPEVRIEASSLGVPVQAIRPVSGTWTVDGQRRG
ncbi:MAG: hypothetical protein IT207_02010 [Fimbriimonadaceae bacterium]|nr:hypothetical protein [Fimbriimonadaceae bacterium]